MRRRLSSEGIDEAAEVGYGEGGGGGEVEDRIPIVGAAEDPIEEHGGDVAGGVGGGVHEAGDGAAGGAADVGGRGPGRAELEIDRSGAPKQG